MNYKPFATLPVGAVFRDFDHQSLVLMKTDAKERAVVLDSVWIDNKLYPRGALVEVAHNECVIALEDGPDLSLPLVRKDPIDPRRKFWKDGDKVTVGREKNATVNVFAGLFLYSGFGMGTYYAARENEQFWCDASEAERKAVDEGLPFVNFDSFSWTNDPNLAHDRAQAQQRFDERRAREVAAASTVSNEA